MISAVAPAGEGCRHCRVAGVNDSRDQRALRASDADRDRVAESFREAAAEGRLSLAEFEAAQNRSRRARVIVDGNGIFRAFADEFGALDVPPGAGGPERRQGRVRWRRRAEEAGGTA